MVKLHKSQFAKLAGIALLLLITPFLSTSMRSPYLYLLFNLLIIALGAESGLLSAFSKPPDDKKPVVVVASPKASPNKGSGTDTIDGVCESSDGCENSAETVVKPAAVARMQKVKKCPSTPSLFFIGCGGNIEDEGMEEEVDDEEEEEVDVIGGQELFTKAETFIGNFYKQLKIQREESWKKIHGFYHKAF